MEILIMCLITCIITCAIILGIIFILCAFKLTKNMERLIEDYNSRNNKK